VRDVPNSPSGQVALAELARRLDGAGVRWLLAGSAGRALIGYEVVPRDLDVEVDGPEMPAAAAALGLVARPERGGGVSSLRATGTIAGVAVDLSADIAVEGPGGRLEPDFALQVEHAHPAEVGGRPALVAPVEETLARAMVRDDLALVARITDAAGDRPALRPAYLARRLSAAASAAR
jgi:hypothetical protein